MPAVTTLDFDPTTSLFGLDVRLETLALAAVIFFVLLIAAFSSGRMQAAMMAGLEEDEERPRPLRRDDLLLIAFGAVPGAVVGARVDYGLIHADYFSQDWTRLLDPAQGGLALTLGVVLGTGTAIAVAVLLNAPVSRWLHVAAVPLLLGLGLGKLAMLLGGDGQGQFSDGPWAVAFAGPGPWQSANPDVPATASQAIEGALVLLAALAVMVVPLLLRLRLRRWGFVVRPGLAPNLKIGLLTGYGRFLTVVVLWAAIRFGVAFTWRDALVLDQFDVEQLILAGAIVFFVAAGLTASFAQWWRRRRAAVKTQGPKGPPASNLLEPKRGPEPWAWR
jgi:prolipoprotein diacylglyceryltransferase